jgi:hypothetical protein
MQGIFRVGLLAICLMLVLAQSVTAFDVSHITIDPQGSLTPGTPVAVTGTIDFIPSSDKTFERSHELQFSTGLEKATWIWTLVINGTEIPQPSIQKNPLTISGDILSHPSNVHELLKFKLEGSAPTVSRTTNKTLIRIQEIGEKGIVINESIVVQNRTVVSISCCVPRTDFVEDNLQTFRTHIDEKNGMGINTTEAEEKYLNASGNYHYSVSIYSVKHLEALNRLDIAQRDIDGGERLVDKAWAEKEVADAQVPINNVDAVIAWFKGNASTRDDAQLPAIITKREIAVSYISTARDQIGNGKYALAREKAHDAFNKGNESYTDALRRKGEVHEHTLWEDWFSIPPPCKCGGVFLVSYLTLVVVIIGIKIAIPIVAILGVYYLIRKGKGAKPE